MGRRPIDLTGKRYGRLVCIEPAPRTDMTLNIDWMCRCDCGNLTRVQVGMLGNGRTKSCGCLRREIKRDEMLKRWKALKVKAT